MSTNRLPDVIIGGAPRSGTTFLCELLAKHPDIFVARPVIPEPKICLTPHPDGDSGLLARYAALFADAPPGALLMEKTSNYFENDEARARLARILMGTKFIFILREPVARAYSNWAWSRKNKLETLSFAQALTLEGHRPNPLPPEREYARPFDYFKRGRYGTLARKWIDAIGRERIGFFIFEDAVSEPERFAAYLQEFLGVHARPWSELATGRINAAEPGEGIEPGLAAELHERFRPEVALFSKVTGVDVSRWGY